VKQNTALEVKVQPSVIGYVLFKDKIADKPEAERIVWFDVKAGQENVCPCGQYFKLVKAEGEF